MRIEGRPVTFAVAAIRPPSLATNGCGRQKPTECTKIPEYPRLPELRGRVRSIAVKVGDHGRDWGVARIQTKKQST